MSTPLDIAARQISEMEAAYADTFEALEAKLAALQVECTQRAQEAAELRAEVAGLKAMEAATRMERDQARAMIVEMNGRLLENRIEVALAVTREMSSVAFVSRDLVHRALVVLGDENLVMQDAIGRAALLLAEALGR